MLAADINGDGSTDIVLHNRADGRFIIRLNGGYPGNGFSVSCSPAFRSQVTSAWRVILADFTGDGFDDVADYAVASGDFYIHQNLGNCNFDPNYLRRTTCATAGRVCMFGQYTGSRSADLVDLNITDGHFIVWVWAPEAYYPPLEQGDYSSGFNVMGLPIHIGP